MSRSIAGRLLLLPLVCAAGCASPYAQDRLAAAGAGLGGIAGAVIGHQTGHGAEGALIGAALGAATGAVTGGAIDEAEARNRREIAYRIGRAPPEGAVSVDEVISMVHSGVPETVVVSFVENHGMAYPVGSADLIRMQQMGVPQGVMAATQRPPRAPQTVVVEQRPQPTTVIVERPYDPWGPRYYYRGGCRGPRASVGVSYHTW
jgi:Glycine zipper